MGCEGRWAPFPLFTELPTEMSQSMLGIMLFPRTSFLLVFKDWVKRKQFQLAITEVPADFPAGGIPGRALLPVLAAVDVHLACQGRPWALQADIHHRKLVHLRDILQRDHIVANLWDPQAQVQFHLPERSSQQSSRCALHWICFYNGKSREDAPESGHVFIANS